MSLVIKDEAFVMFGMARAGLPPLGLLARAVEARDLRPTASGPDAPYGFAQGITN